ncbi:STAS domain-containing protein [Fusibacter bizertensis]|uniref:STAS domain-containing protein n=1 Tax=Fusibacter bizertensis TaxID=1488331 RepID=A0ABT6NCT9_9FIRM|nr:STAS domain-containing protein [Fusibacter bizertensis]MDH8678247.1 STAS domain-containing protein [Fusibacter bizertensis]
MEEQLLGSCLRLILVDGLTANNVSKFNDKLEAIFSSDISFSEIVLDLASTKNIDSVGVTFVIGLYKKAEDFDKKFSVSGASEDILSLFKLMKLDQFFDICD